MTLRDLARTAGPRRAVRLAAPLALGAWLLTGCVSGPVTPAQLAQAHPPASSWQAARPHDGQVAQLSDWWRQQGDAELVQLIDAAQQVSPSIAASLARIDQARAQKAQAGGALLPQVNAQAQTLRAKSPAQPLAQQSQLALQWHWELDLIGAAKVANDAAKGQVESAQAQWHEARVLVAAEVATRYHGLRSCTQQEARMKQELASRGETLRLSALSAKAGLLSQQDQAQVAMLVEEGRSRLSALQAQCEVQWKALTALTAIPEPQLRERLAQALQREASPTPFAVAAVPADVLHQRPDVHSAAREVMMAQAQERQALAMRLPRLSLDGYVGRARIETGMQTLQGPTWSFGPLALSLPVFDAGQRAAQQQAAKSGVTASVSQYQATVRQAVREVEEALVQLSSTEARWQSAVATRDAARQLMDAQRKLHAQGLLSTVQLEESRRNTLAAEMAELDLQSQRHQAWIQLYRAVGGGFQPAQAGG